MIIKSKIKEINNILAEEKLNELNIPKDVLELVDIGQIDISTEISDTGRSVNQFLIMLLPTYLVTIIVTAGTPIAIDIVAGERERNTFEALLSTRANRLSILIGKFMAVLAFALIATFMAFIGLVLGIVLNPEIIALVGQILGISTIITPIYIPILALILLILSIITLTILFAGIQIAISTWSKTLKEAQTYLSYLMFPATVPAFITIFMGASDMQLYMAFIPVFNTIASFKMIISGVIDYGFLIAGVLSNIVFIFAIMYGIIKLFNNENAVIK